MGILTDSDASQQSDSFDKTILSNTPIISAKHISKQFDLASGFFAKKDKSVYAVNDVSFDIARGEAYGLVGESGCGKTTTARLLVRMYSLDGGSVFYTDKDNVQHDISLYNHHDLKLYREKVKYIFQDPARSLN